MERIHHDGPVEKVRRKSFCKKICSPVGVITLVASETALLSLMWGREAEKETETNPVLDLAEQQLTEYFSGKRKSFDLPLSPEGTNFQKSVWEQLRKIPFGQTITYGEQARRLGKPSASRAVGAANGKNPIGIIVPCHRVIGASGSLTGFAGGLDAKKKLLQLEGTLPKDEGV